jgi:hypothetical protein
MIRVTKNRGFQLTFENELTISVQIGSMNYCSRKDRDFDFEAEMKEQLVESIDAEIAIWDNSHNWYKFPNDDEVKGWVGVDEIGRWIEAVRKAKDIKDIKL